MNPVTIIDYKMGNVNSLIKAFRRIGCPCNITSEPSDIIKAKKLLLPGVGHFKMGMERLKRLGIIPALEEAVLGGKIPILGICLGMQLFSEWSEEGGISGLGWIKASTIKFNFDSSINIKIPHIGWNTLEIEQDSNLLNGIAPDDMFYFVHSYHVNCRDPQNIISLTEYGLTFVSMLQRENIFGCQFHPEKSHGCGLKILRNFAEGY